MSLGFGLLPGREVFKPKHRQGRGKFFRWVSLTIGCQPLDCGPKATGKQAVGVRKEQVGRGNPTFDKRIHRSIRQGILRVLRSAAHFMRGELVLPRRYKFLSRSFSLAKTAEKVRPVKGVRLADGGEINDQ